MASSSIRREIPVMSADPSNLEPLRGPEDERPRNDAVPVTAAHEQKAEIHHQQMWNSIWLSPVFLFGFVVLFTALAISLVLLWHYSRNSNGFSLITSNHYSWTYGPTAILVIIVSLWRQVDFWCKALAPWTELHKGYSTAPKSVLLDYISPIQPTTLARAIKHRHVSVIATVLGFVVLKLVTLVSTGFLIPISSISTENVTISATTSLHGSRFNEDTSGGTVNDPSMAYIAYAVLNQNLPYPEGTTNDLAYQKFFYPANNSRINASVSAEVDAFVPYLDCELAEAFITSPSPNDTEIWVSTPINATSASCNLTAPYGYSTISIPCDPRFYACSPRILTGSIIPADCSRTTSAHSDPYWELLTISDFQYDQSFSNYSTNKYGPNITEWEMDIHVSAILCQSGYTIDKARVTYNLTQSPPQIDVKGPQTRTSTMLSGLSNSDLATYLRGALIAALPVFGIGLDGVFFGLMSNISGGDLAPLLNETAMGLAAERVFKSITVQIAREWIFHPDRASLQGSVTYADRRLHIRGLSLWVMVGGFIALAALSCVVLVVRPRNVISREPGPIISMVLILLRSPDVQKILQQHGQAKKRSFLEALSPYRFRTSVTPAAGGTAVFKIETSGVPSGPSSDFQPSKKTVTWWDPFPMWRLVIIIILGLPLAMIAALEVLQHLSDRSEGIADLKSGSNQLNGLYTSYLPALVMLGLATLYNSLDFTVLSFAPYQKLQAGDVPANKSLMISLLGKMPLHALWSSLRRRQWSALASSVPAFAGSVLTIIVSGLFTIQEVSISRNATVDRLDQFSLVWENSAGFDNSAAVLTTLTEALNLTYPQFTYGELAFPTMGLSTSTKMENSGAGHAPLTLRVPALRASLNCTTIPDSDYNVSISQAFVSADSPDHYAPELDISARALLPSGCHLGGDDGNLSYISWAPSYMLSSDSAGYVGAALDLHVGPLTDTFSSFGESNTETQRDNQPGCPSLSFIFGYFSVNRTAKSNFTVMMCYQLLEEVQTDVTFEVPGFTISTLNQPAPDESTVKSLQSSSTGETAFEFRPQSNLGDKFRMFPESGYNSSDSLFDPFFQAVIFGKTPVAPQALLGSRNQKRLHDAIQGFYRRYMAQAISQNMRVQDGTPGTPKIVGSLIDLQVSRLKQNNAAKITLQVLLAIMFIFGTLAYSLTNIRRKLPGDPYSIASVASLLAGSEICSEKMLSLIPNGADWMSKKELEQQNVWQGWLFRLGWWDSNKGGRKIYLIDGRAVADDFGPATSPDTTGQLGEPGIEDTETTRAEAVGSAGITNDRDELGPGAPEPTDLRDEPEVDTQESSAVEASANAPDTVDEIADTPCIVEEGAGAPDTVNESAEAPDTVEGSADAPDTVQGSADATGQVEGHWIGDTGRGESIQAERNTSESLRFRRSVTQ